MDRLRETTMYQARILIYRTERSSNAATLLYTTPFYYTTTAGSDGGLLRKRSKEVLKKVSR